MQADVHHGLPSERGPRRLDEDLVRTTTLLPVRFRVCFRGFAGVVHGVVMMAVGHMRMVTGFVMIAGFVVLRGFVVVPRGMFVMVSGLLVVLCDRMGHSLAP
jgi:hypothetical protein